jgi:hypothetical protein
MSFPSPPGTRALAGIGSDWITSMNHGGIRMSDQQTRWVARLKPMPDNSVEALLGHCQVNR